MALFHAWVVVALVPLAGATEAALGLHQVTQASLPIGELHRVLQRTSSDMLCHMQGGNCHPNLESVASMTAGTNAFSGYVETLPTEQRAGVEELIQKIRFDIFRPAVSRVTALLQKSAAKPKSVILEHEECNTQSTGVRLACEVAGFVELSQKVTAQPDLMKQSEDENTDTKKFFGNIIDELKTVSKTVTELRKKGTNQRAETHMMRQILGKAESEVSDALHGAKYGAKKGPVAPGTGAWEPSSSKYTGSPGKAVSRRWPSILPPLPTKVVKNGSKYGKKGGGGGGGGDGGAVAAVAAAVAGAGDDGAGGADDAGDGQNGPSAGLIETGKQYGSKYGKKVDSVGVTLRLPPGDEALDKDITFTTNYVAQKDQLRYDSGDTMTMDMGTDTQGRFHRWSQINGLTLYYEDVTQYDKDAICVDGSRARMYYSPAQTEKDAKNWHVYLQGGYFCFDHHSCFVRCTSYKEHCSTIFWWEKAIKMGGLFSPQHNPKMAGWHHTFGSYCTSDAWMGATQLTGFDPFVHDTPYPANHDKTTANKIMYLRGHRVMRATLAANIVKGMGRSPGHLLYFSGCSAGGIGLTNSVDLVGAWMKEDCENPDLQHFGATWDKKDCSHHITIIAAIDVAMLVIGGRATMSEWGKTSFEEQTKRAWKNLGLNYLYPPQLKKNLPNQGIANDFKFAPWRLLLGEFRIPLLRVSHLQITTIDDDFALAVTVANAHPTYGPKNEMYFHDYRERMMRSLERIDVTTARDGGYYSSVFSFRCYWHCIIENDSMYRIRISTDVEDPEVGNMHLGHLLDAQLDKRQGLWAVDRCQYFDCTCMTMIPFQPYGTMNGILALIIQGVKVVPLYEMIGKTQDMTGAH